jgi:outer membrane biosynthesis protein TonB
MRRTGPERRPTDGDYAEIVAAERLYRNIFVWDVNGEEPRQYVPSHGFLDCEQRSSGVSPQGPFPADAILLSHNEVGNHYSILIPSEIASDLPRPPRFSANTFFEIRQPVAEDEQSQSKGGEEAEPQERNRHSVDREEKERHEPEHEKDHDQHKKRKGKRTKRVITRSVKFKKKRTKTRKNSNQEQRKKIRQKRAKRSEKRVSARKETPKEILHKRRTNNNEIKPATSRSMRNGKARSQMENAIQSTKNGSRRKRARPRLLKRDRNGRP